MQPDLQGKTAAQISMNVSPTLATTVAFARYICTLLPPLTSYDYTSVYYTQDIVGDYQCSCVNGFSGRNCDGNFSCHVYSFDYASAHHVS